ncbi:hypothetical protein A2U01_0008816, partial [Trifolium medium]|nr:hypothetical protein [Trifolium medium]
VDVPDKLMWHPDPDRAYSVRGAYQLLTHLVSVAMAAHKDVIWNKTISLKVVAESLKPPITCF